MNQLYTFICSLSFLFISLHPTQSQNALDFDGVDDFVQTDYAGISGDNRRTVEAWIKTTANAIPNMGGLQQVILDYGSFVTGGRFTFNVLWGNAIRLEVGGNGVSGTTPVNDGMWHHVAVTFDPNQPDQIRLYVDGELDAVGTTTVTLNTVLGTNVKIGQRIDDINPFTGMIDEVRIWDVALTQAEIQANMNKEICDPPSSLVAYYNFNQGVPSGVNTTENMLMDISGNNNSGTLNNFSLNGSSSNWVAGAQITPGAVTINDVFEICSDSYTWAVDGMTYNASGNYTAVMMGANSCDTTATLDLTLVDIDNSVMQTGMTLTANAIGVNYQWLDCDNNLEIIPNETGATFSPTVSGNYAVELSQGSCVELSACTMIDIVSVGNLENRIQLDVFPNPAIDFIFIKKETTAVLDFQIINTNGQVLTAGQLNDEATEINFTKNPSGVYFIKIVDPNTSDFAVKKIVK